MDVSGRLKHIVRNVAAIEQRTPDHLSGIGGIVLTIESLADDRPHAVGANDKVGFDLGAIGEGEHDAVVSLLERHQTVAQMDQPVIQSAGKNLQQVGAVKRVIWRPVTRRSFPPVVKFEELTGLHIPRVDARGRGAHGGNLFAEPDGSKRP